MPKLSTTRKELLTAMMKEAIYQAAVSVLAEHGVEGMTMDRVAMAASVAKGSLYCYFQGKQDLLEFVYAKTIDPIQKATEEIVCTSLPAAEKLEAILRAVFGHLAKHHELFSLLLKDASTCIFLEPTGQTRRDIMVGQFAVVFRQGIEQGLFQPLDPTQLAKMFFGAMAELWRRALASGEFQQADQMIQALLSVFLNGVCVRAAVSTGQP